MVPFEKLPAHLAQDLDFRQDLLVDTSRIRSELGYAEVTTPAQCLERTIAWERTHRAPADADTTAHFAAEDAAIAASQAEMAPGSEMES